MPAPESHRYRQVAESFGIDPERYDRARPRYPEALQYRYDWERSYTGDEWLEQLASSGAVTQLPPDKRAEVLAGAGAALQEMGGSFTVSMITVAIIASV